VPGIEAAVPAGQNPRDERIDEKASKLVLDRRDRLSPESAGVLLKLRRPEVPHLLVGRPLRSLLPESILMKQSQHIRECRLRLIEQQQECVPEDVLESDAPGIGEELLQRFDDPVRGHGAPERRHVRQWIESELLLRIRDIEVRQILRAIVRHPLNHSLCKVAVRVEECQSQTVDEILSDQRF
jgi:hypothetical protein